jgi:hypothetical protein
MDGHGRIQALVEMRKRGEDMPLFPVVYVDAKNDEEARQKLLRLNSQYGQMTIDSVLEFADGCDIDFDELQLPGVDIVNQETQKGEKEKLIPYTKVHVLISFHPDEYIKISEQLEKIKMTDGVEYEQQAN